MQTITAMSALPIASGRAVAPQRAVASAPLARLSALAVPSQRVVAGKGCGGCGKCGRCRVLPNRSRSMAVPMCSMSAHHDCHAHAAEPVVTTRKQANPLVAVWTSLWTAAQRTFKVMLAAAAAVVASFVPFVGQAYARGKPAPPPPAFEATGSPLVDSWNLVFCDKLDFAGKMNFISADPLLAIVPVGMAIIAGAVLWAMTRKAPEDDTPAPPPPPAQPDKLDAARERQREHNRALEAAAGTSAPSRPSQSRTVASDPAESPEPTNAQEFLNASFNGVLKPEAAGSPSKMSNEVQYAVSRASLVKSYFPSAEALDDFIFKVEMALNTYGFNGDNSIAVANMCRDEITCGLKYKIEETFPLVFNINGLGGGITAGVIGFGAGLSHSPKSVAGKARYVFFSFPHIAITPDGTLGTVGRPGQDKPNSACGALIAALGQLSAEGVEANIKDDSAHNPTDPEYSILKARIASRMLKENADPAKMDLADITKLAERQISDDLEYLISEAVNPATADYAIVTGVQIHNWSDKYDDETPNMEFVAPTKVSVIIDGERTELDLSKMPAPTPRQLRMLMDKPEIESTRNLSVATGMTTLTENNGSPMFSSTTERGMREQRSEEFAGLLSKAEKKNFAYKAAAPPADDSVL